MAQKLKYGLSLVALILVFVAGMAQEQRKTQHKTPRWVSDKGYWVVETNIHSPLNHQVNFYTNDNVLFYKKSFTGIKLDADKRKFKMKFKKILETSIVAWQKEKNEQAIKNEGLVLSNAVPL